MHERDLPLLRPVGLIGGAAAARAVDAGLARPLAGGPLAFTAVECIEPQRRRALGLGAVPREWQARLDALTRPRPPFAGLPLDRPLVMGILNVTPDSFSDGQVDSGAALRHGVSLLEAGADLLDVGGESTRPGAGPVAAEEQIRRVEPVIRALSQRGAAVSVDTREPHVMAAALAAGARIVNDVSALAAPGAVQAVAVAGVSAILVHMQGEPGTMQREPRYDDVVREVAEHLQGRIAACLAAGIPLQRLAVDPGIGFGKRGAHNAAILDEVAVLHGLGAPVVLGASRKGWLGAFEAWAPAERLGGSIGAAMAGLDRGVQILRVHDVSQTHQARLAWSALNHAR